MAPDLETIFDVEEAVEAACKTVFESFGVKAFMQRETQDLPKERVDIQLQLGAPTGHRGKMTAGSPGQWVRDAWNGILLVNIITPRMIPDGMARRYRRRGIPTGSCGPGCGSRASTLPIVLPRSSCPTIA